jgi:uncharacterized protein (DUF305 family)
MDNHAKHSKRGAYKPLGIEMAVDFVIMYFVMYTMIATIDHLLLNINNVYMTLMMVAPMTIVMLVGMRSMFQSRPLNLIIGTVAALVFIGSFAAMRAQAGVGDAEFLRSMIPHHSGAILMCERASLRDPEIVALCQQILESQKEEIAKMEAILLRY